MRRILIMFGLVIFLVLCASGFFSSQVSASFVQTITNFFVTVSNSSITQQSFRFYVGYNNITPKDAWPPESSDLPENGNIGEAQFPPPPGAVLRLRIGLNVTRLGLAAGKRKFKLQYGQASSNTCNTITVWNDIGGIGSSGAWRAFNFPSVSDGSFLTNTVLAGSSVLGTYQEQALTPFNPTVGIGTSIEYDWAIQNNASNFDGVMYCFRVANSNGTPLDSYAHYPMIKNSINQSNSTTNTINKATGGSFDLSNNNGTKITLTAPPNYSTSSQSFQAVSYDYSNYLDEIGSQPVGKMGAHSYIYRLFADNGNGTASTSFDQPLSFSIQYTDSEISGLNESSLKIYNYEGSSWAAVATTVDTANNTATADITNFSSFGLFGDSAPTPTPTPAAGGGGGGGGGGSFGLANTATPLPSQLATSITVRGKAYPGATISFLRDALLIKKVQADALGNFEVTESDIAGGGYNFSLWALDTSNLRSNTYSFYLNTINNSANTVFGVLMPPTIAINKEIVKPDEQIKISGSSVPDSYVIIEVHSDPQTFTVKSTSQGVYSQEVQATAIGIGSHVVKSKSKAMTGEETNFSNTLSFGVGVAPQPQGKIGDLNKDAKVNIIDFSILAYWYKRTGAPPDFDLNKDGKVDLRDFSIMVFNWTG